jgi:iron complex outermembrane receptor protein
VKPHSRVTVDSVVFYNRHDDLLSVEPGKPFLETTPPPSRLILPIVLGNGVEGSSRGAEIAVDWSPAGSWLLAGSYSYVKLSLRSSPGSVDTTTAASTRGSTPRHTAQLRSQLSLGGRASFDVMARWVGSLPALKIPSYLGLDARLGWRPVPRLELAVVGQNLADARHAEFAAGGLVTEVRRGVYVELTWRP